MTTVRRNTYVLNRRPLTISHPGSASGLDRQNLMRIKVNRIALIQELHVEHIVQYLVKTGVLNGADLKHIERGSMPPDRTRLLLDLLASKGKDTEWYKHFRNSLLNPDASPILSKRYRCLVEFLDNTIIHRPTSQGNLFRDFTSLPASKLPNPSSFHHYNTLPPIQRNGDAVNPAKHERKVSPDILKIHDGDSSDFLSPRDPQGDSKDEAMDHEEEGIVNPSSSPIVKGYIHHWVPVPADFSHSLIPEPDDLFRSLGDSPLAEDKAQLHLERQALKTARSLELMHQLQRKKMLPHNMEIIQSEPAHDLLASPDQFHLYAKHFTLLLHNHGVNLLHDLANSFLVVLKALQPSDNINKIGATIKQGLDLTDLFSELNQSKEAEQTLISVLGFLNRHPRLETVMATYKGYIKLMHLMNKEYNLRSTSIAYFRITEVIWQIEKMSFGQDLVEKGEMYLELSHMMLESGSVNSAYSWAFKSLQHVSPEEKTSVINVLCNAVMAYCSKWNIKRAEQLAVQAVQLSREYFGSRHPMYLKALLTYCYYSNEFRQDDSGVEIARHTLQVARITYGIETPQQAHAHRALCKALIVAQNFKEEEYLDHAQRAFSISQACYPPAHPAKYLFHFTLAYAQYWKALQLPPSEQEATLSLALQEISHAHSQVLQHFGDLCLRHAQVLSLMAQISIKMNNIMVGGNRAEPRGNPRPSAGLTIIRQRILKLTRFKTAESLLVTSDKILSLCLPSHSNYLLVTQATLAMFYAMDPVGKVEDAKILLQKVVKELDSPGVLVNWVVFAFDHLVALHQSAGEQKEAAIIEAQKEEWVANNPPHTSKITLPVLMEPPRPYAEFLADFNIWQKRVDRWKEAKESEECCHL